MFLKVFSSRFSLFLSRFSHFPLTFLTLSPSRSYIFPLTFCALFSLMFSVTFPITFPTLFSLMFSAFSPLQLPHNVPLTFPASFSPLASKVSRPLPLTFPSLFLPYVSHPFPLMFLRIFPSYFLPFSPLNFLYFHSHFSLFSPQVSHPFPLKFPTLSFPHTSLSPFSLKFLTLVTSRFLPFFPPHISSPTGSCQWLFIFSSWWASLVFFLQSPTENNGYQSSIPRSPFLCVCWTEKLEESH